MKKLLLLGVAALCTLPMMAEADSHAISLEWQNLSLQGNASTMRAMTVSNGVMYIPNTASKKVEMWKDNAKIGEVPVDGTPMACFNISTDDAGNIIISMRDWAASPGIATGFAAPNDKLFIISADGSKKATVATNGGLPSTRTDLFGHSRGDMLGEGGSIYVAGVTSYDFTFSEVMISNGKMDRSDVYTIAGSDLPDGINDNLAMKTPSPYTTDGLSLDEVSGNNRNTTVVTPTTTFLSGYNMLGENTFAALLPHYMITSQYGNRNPFCDGELGMGNSVFQVEFDEDEEAYALNGKFYRMPQHNGCTSFSLFELEGKQFILYPAGSNNCDGWAIAEVSYADTPQSDKDDEEYLVCRKWAETNEDGGILYETAPVGYCNSIFAEVSATEDKVVYVYQYTPGAYLAKYKVDLNNWFDNGGVNNIDTDFNDVEVYGGKGFIGVEGGMVSIYTASGTLVAKSAENINVAPGLYIANTGKRAVKVVVK